MCFQLLEDLGRGIYCVYRSKKGSPGYPPTTPWLTELLFRYNKCTSDTEAILVCLAFIEFFVEYRFDGQNYSEPLNNSFLHYKGEIGRAIKLFKGDKDCTKEAADLACKVRTRLHGVTTSHERLTKDWSIRNIKQNVGWGLFPIVFDEYEGLLISPEKAPNVISLFVAMQRTLALVRETGIVCLFVGREGVPVEFKVPKSCPSAREPTIKMIVPTYLLCDSLDAHLNRKFVINYENINTVDDHCIYYRSKALEDFALSCGRPLWKCFENYCGAFDVAMKIMMRSDPELIDLAAILIRTGAKVFPMDELASKLVSSCMATLLQLDLDQKACLMYYCPEPLLSNAARVHMHNNVNFLRGLEHYRHLFSSGTFTDQAEKVVGRLILLRAFDKALEDKLDLETACLDAKGMDENNMLFVQSSLLPKLGLTTVKRFLMSLSGLKEDEIETNFGLSNEFLSGFVTCCQIVPVKQNLEIDQLFLMHGFARSVGFSLSNSSGADVIIPVLRSDNRMSCIAVKFKETCSDDTYDMVTVSNQLNFDQCGDFPVLEDKDDFARIVIQLGEQDADASLASALRTWSSIKLSNGEKKSILLLRSLRVFDHLLSFEAETDQNQIRGVLKEILSTKCDSSRLIRFKYKDTCYLNRQFSEFGAETLSIVASPCLSKDYLSLYDAQGRVMYKKEREKVLETFKNARVFDAAFDYRHEFTVTPKAAANIETVEDANQDKETKRIKIQ